MRHLAILFVFTSAYAAGPLAPAFIAERAGIVRTNYLLTQGIPVSPLDDSAAAQICVADEQGRCLPAIITPEALYEEHHDATYRYLVLTGSTPADADEFAQESYLRLLQTLRRGEDVRNARHWLFRVIRNLRADSHRQSGRRLGIRTAEERDERADPGPDPETELLLSERAERFRAAMAQLTERQSEILHLRAEGLKLRGVAELLGITLQSVSEMCARAIDRVGRFVNE